MYGCVIWPLKSHPSEVITTCAPEHLPQRARTSGCYQKRLVAVELQRAPDPHQAAPSCQWGSGWQGREKSICGKCICLLGTAGFMAGSLSLLISETSTNPAHTGMPLGCSGQGGFRKQDVVTPKPLTDSLSKHKYILSPLSGVAPSYFCLF